MSESTMCEVVAEILGRGASLSPAQTAHTEICPVCRDLREGIAQAMTAGSAFLPPPASSPLVARIRQAVAAEPLPSSASLASGAKAAPVPAGLGISMLVPAVVLLLMLGAVLWNAWPTAVPVTPPGIEPMASGNGSLNEPLMPASTGFVLSHPVPGAASASSAPTQSEEGNR